GARWTGRRAAPCRSARPRTGPCARGCRRSSVGSAVELRREESRRGLEDLIRPAQLPDLPLQLVEARALFAGQAKPQTVVDLGAADPVAQRLMRDAELGR